MDLGLTGKKALVCGASKGLGLASARQLAIEGATVILLSRDKAALESACNEIGSNSASFVACDLMDEDSTTAAIGEIQMRFGCPDIIIHNVGGPKPTMTEDTTVAEWTAGFERLFVPVVRLNEAFLPGMKEHRWGRIVTVTSLSVLEPIPFLAVSNVIRSASTAYSKSLSEEVARFNITVNCVAPGMVSTDRIEDLMATRSQKAGQSMEEYVAEVVKTIPAQRLGHPDEFGAVVCFLCSEQSSYITGSTICIDGGKRRSTY